MLFRVQYPTFNYDYVDAAALGRLIDSKCIIKFLRPSETFWIDLEQGPIRRVGATRMDTVYSGPERRKEKGWGLPLARDTQQNEVVNKMEWSGA
jgi:hypothetical protein